jgi:hypothetical protein
MGLGFATIFKMVNQRLLFLKSSVAGSNITANAANMAALSKFVKSQYEVSHFRKNSILRKILSFT